MQVFQKLSEVVTLFTLSCLCHVAHSQLVLGQSRNGGRIELPASSIRHADDGTHRAYTNTVVNMHAAQTAPGSTWETPASIACIYKMVAQVSGCPINRTTALPSGGSGTIAIVIAYHDATALNDLTAFSSYFHLLTPNLPVVYASGSQPPQDTTGGWELEASLDMEWAHAMSPSSPIVLIEASSNSSADLAVAERLASSYNGVSVVNMSFASLEYSGETSNDSLFTGAKRLYLAATGDTAFEKSYPAMSGNVVAVGGTSILRDGNGLYTSESSWDNSSGGGGGGISAYEPRPSYQNVVSYLSNSKRGTPDISADADPNSGVAVYDSTAYQGTVYNWIQVGGTSLASPLTAGRVNTFLTASSYFDTTPSFLTAAYNTYGSPSAYAQYFRDITSGVSCSTGWDICAGLGSLLGASSGFPILSQSQSSLSFTSAHSSSGAQQNQTGTFTNSSAQSITLQNAYLSGSNQYNYFSIQSNTCQGTLTPGSSCSTVISGDPANVGGSGTQQLTAVLNISSNAWNSPAHVTLSETLSCSGACSK